LKELQKVKIDESIPRSKKFFYEKGYFTTKMKEKDKLDLNSFLLNFVFDADHSYPNIPKNMPGTSNLKELL